jgi:sugar lactone lactonase YvrE
MRDDHQVVTKSLNSVSNTLTIVAGTGVVGPTLTMLSNPHGIFVDINFDLYVADSGNDRIQLFQSGQLSGRTIAGNESSSTTITLSYPTGIVLDGDNNLFIVDSSNNRIIGSGPNGFRCLVGCSGSSGSASNQLWSPHSLSFDSYGNMFVTDYGNNRIQKFNLTTRLCSKFDII